MSKKFEKYKDKIQMVIGLMGPKGCGKDVLADYSIKNLNATGKIITASFLKKMCSKVFGLGMDYFSENKDNDFLQPVELTNALVKKILLEMRAAIPEKILSLKEFNPYRIGVQNYSGRFFKTPRQLLQYVGSDFIHAICKPFHCITSYEAVKNKPGIWFITDLRFKVENNYASKCFKFFYPVKIIGRNEVKAGKEEHLSEKEWKEIQPFATIDNSGSLDDFYKNAILVFDKIKKDINEKLSIMSEAEINQLFDSEKPAIDNKDPNIIRIGRFNFSSPSVANQHIVRDME